MIGEFASTLFGVEMRALYDVDRELGNTILRDIMDDREKRTPVPMTRTDLCNFAAEHRYPANRASSAWKELRWADGLPKDDPYPRIRYIGPPPERNRPATVDLWSVYERLKETDISQLMWGRPLDPEHTDKSAYFLAHVVNEKLLPDEPLEFRNLD